MISEVMSDAKERMQGAVISLESDLAGYRTGRAAPQLLDRIVVEMYGVEMPLNQMASVSVPEAQQLAIKPYDVNSISAIERAIMSSDLGLMPNNDGKIIRLNLPRLTEERRRELTKLVGKRIEDARVAVRNVRRDAQNDLRDFQKESVITEDDLHRGQDDLQKLTDGFIGKINDLGKAKEEEIMEV